MSFTEDSWLYNEIEKIARNSQRLLWYLAAKKTCADTAIIRVLDDFADGAPKEVNELPPKYADGSFRVRRNGILEYRFVYLDKIHSVYGKTEEICWDKRTEIMLGMRAIKQKDIIENKDILFEEFLSRWYTYKENQEPKLSTSQLESIDRVIRLHIPHFIKKVKLRNINEGLIKDALNAVKSSRMREYAYTVYSDSLSYAKAHNLINGEPWKFRRVKHKPQSRRPLEDSEYELLINSVDSDLKRIILGYCWTGCRLRELLSIKYGDINDGIIKVWDAKTDKWKYIPLLPPLAEVIGKGAPAEKIFDYKAVTISKWIRKACDSVGLTDISPHSLRHTFGSVLYDSGVDLKTIQLWMGHSTLKVTEDIYTKRRKFVIKNDIKLLIERVFRGN